MFRQKHLTSLSFDDIDLDEGLIRNPYKQKHSQTDSLRLGYFTRGLIKKYIESCESKGVDYRNGSFLVFGNSPLTTDHINSKIFGLLRLKKYRHYWHDKSINAELLARTRIYDLLVKTHGSIFSLLYQMQGHNDLLENAFVEYSLMLDENIFNLPY